MLLNGGTLDGVQILSPKTIALMTLNHLPDGKDLPALSRSLFSEVTYNGVGFGLGFAVTLDTTRTMLPGSIGDYFWGGAASTYFWIDPREELITIFMTQLMPSTTYHDPPRTSHAGVFGFHRSASLTKGVLRRTLSRHEGSQRRNHADFDEASGSKFPFPVYFCVLVFVIA